MTDPTRKLATIVALDIAGCPARQLRLKLTETAQMCYTEV